MSGYQVMKIIFHGQSGLVKLQYLKYLGVLNSGRCYSTIVLLEIMLHPTLHSYIISNNLLVFLCQ